MIQIMGIRILKRCNYSHKKTQKVQNGLSWLGIKTTYPDLPISSEKRVLSCVGIYVMDIWRKYMKMGWPTDCENSK